MTASTGKILLVDDEENLLRSTAKTLLRAGFDVETARSNTEAAQKIKDGEDFGLIILDLNMPDFSGQASKYAGVELLEWLRQNLPQTPVIINSAWDEVETAKLCLDKGAADFFVKGRSEDMFETIYRVLNQTT
ncbi:MAG: response regulator [Chloroflexi bacterium]|nr:MAG: response regulator [Chloroflexota bacterium]